MADAGSRLRKQLESSNFDPQNYVKQLSQQSDGDRDLQEHRQKIQTLADETAQNLKKNVYKNYRQFIETAKEISYLESEMYQLSHILTEQKSIMESITQTLLSTDKDETAKEMMAAFPKETEEVKQRTLTTLLEKVEGCQNLMEAPGRYLVYNGDLIEYDLDNMCQIQKVHAFLMNDCLLIATWLANRRGPVKYKYDTLYDLEPLAIVNVKDNPPMKDMFRILMFPDTRTFQAENSKIKKEWLEILEETKKNKVAKERHTKEEEVPKSPLRPEVSTNPFDEEEPLESEEVVDLSPEWIQDLPEDLDVCIAQRDFEGAVDLLDKLNEYLKEQPAVQTAIRQLRIEGATLLYIHKLCNIFFTSLLETAKEFQMDFAGNTGCYSAFVVWCRSAMKMFVDAFSKQVFDSKESLSTASECVKVAKEHCAQLSEIGLDLTFILQSLLVKDIKAALVSYKDIIIEATKHRNSEEMWRRMNLMTPEALAKLKEEMRSCGMGSFEQYTGDDCWVNLSYTVVAFTKQMMSFLEEGLKLYSPELHMVLLESLREIILVAVQHVDYSLRCEQDLEKKAFILQNASFLNETVLTVVEKRFEEGVGKPAKQLQDLRKSSRPMRINPDSQMSVV
ncbi:exocyst complex component 8 isoform X2 [Denticeps clupeoides]|uniref:exocyst complex component 8 isoform X2 n=1 Tax=Denticeps clupeoides TaxID=299321 RepID=UPI0010A4B8EA|nr:exocyst complex component 8 isoform X2 [Denticeps clupeoides]